MISSKLITNSKLIRSIARMYSSGVSNQSTTSKEAPGLSSAVIQGASQPVGPNVDPKKTGAYKVPEYFCYHNMSYFEAEIEMAKYRCPQPSNKKK